VDKTTGKTYLDLYSQFASQPLGWNHSKLLFNRQWLGKVATQKISNSDMYTEIFADFVDKFAEITSDFKYYFFICGGALAVENALKAAFDWKCQISPKHQISDGKNLDIIHFKQAFHGRSGYTLSLTNTGDLKTKWFPKFPWTRVTNPKIHFPMTSKVNNLESISIREIKDALHKGNVAAIIIEPIQGEGGDNHFRKEFLQELRDLANRYEALLIFDEVQTGMGMTGEMWCYQHFNVVPDLLCFGKKTQVCGFCSGDRIDQAADNVFKASGRINSTWGGNIVDMARASLIMDAIKEERLVQNAKEVGDKLLANLLEIQDKTGKISNVRGKGLMLAFDLPTQEERDIAFEKIRDHMLVLTCGERTIRLRPHLTFYERDIDLVCSFIEKSL
jgi:L-lysine 6-transaminase